MHDLHGDSPFADRGGKPFYRACADIAGGTPEAFTKVIRADYAKWAKVVKDSGAKVD